MGGEMDSEEKSDNSAKEGLQKNGQIVCDEAKDYALQYFRESIPWNESKTSDLKTSKTRDFPWIAPTSWSRLSFAMKYMNYETEPRFLLLDNPFIVQENNEIRRKESARKKKKKKDKEPEELLELQKEGMTEIQPKGAGKETEENDEDDFLDEYGNIKEKGTSVDKIEENKEPEPEVSNN